MKTTQKTSKQLLRYKMKSGYSIIVVLSMLVAVLCCWLPLVSATADGGSYIVSSHVRRKRNKRNRRKLIMGERVKGRRRRLGEDKNLGNDKNEEKNPQRPGDTPEPTTAPPTLATTSVPTVLPTELPTGVTAGTKSPAASPTSAPIDTATLAPTKEPTVSYDFSDLPLQFSLWFPENESLTVEDLNNDKSSIRQGVLDALMEVLCTETDMALMMQGNNTMVSDMENICLVRSFKNNRRRRLEEASSSLLAANPTVSVNLVETTNITYSEWTVSYTVLSIGDFYVREALQNDDTLQGNQLNEAALEAMRQVVQLALDIEIMERTFDERLRRYLNDNEDNEEILQVYSSPTGREMPVFSGLADVSVLSDLDPSMWPALRISGIVLLVVAIVGYSFIVLLSAKRRERVLLENAREEGDSIVLLQSPEGVDEFLAKSDQYLPNTSSPFELDDDDNSEDGQGNIPLPASLHQSPAKKSSTPIQSILKPSSRSRTISDADGELTAPVPEDADSTSMVDQLLASIERVPSHDCSDFSENAVGITSLFGGFFDSRAVDTEAPSSDK